MKFYSRREAEYGPGCGPSAEVSGAGEAVPKRGHCLGGTQDTRWRAPGARSAVWQASDAVVGILLASHTLLQKYRSSRRPSEHWAPTPPTDPPPRRDWMLTDLPIPRRSLGPFIAKNTTITRNAIYIRPERHLVDISETFALVRGLEQRYERIQDFRFLRVRLRA